MPFGRDTDVVPSNIVLDRGSSPATERGDLEYRKSQFAVMPPVAKLLGSLLSANVCGVLCCCFRAQFVYLLHASTLTSWRSLSASRCTATHRCRWPTNSTSCRVWSIYNEVHLITDIEVWPSCPLSCRDCCRFIFTWFSRGSDYVVSSVCLFCDCNMSRDMRQVSFTDVNAEVKYACTVGIFLLVRGRQSMFCASDGEAASINLCVDFLLRWFGLLVISL